MKKMSVYIGFSQEFRNNSGLNEIKCHFVPDGIEMAVAGGYRPWALNLILDEGFSLSSSEEGSLPLCVFSLYLCLVLRPQKPLRAPECLPCRKLAGSGWALQPHQVQMTHLCCSDGSLPYSREAAGGGRETAFWASC